MLIVTPGISEETRINTIKFIIAVRRGQWDKCTDLISNIDYNALHDGETIGAILINNQAPYELFESAVLQPIAKACEISYDSSIIKTDGATFGGSEIEMLAQRLQNTSLLRILLEREDYVSATAYITRLSPEAKTAELDKALSDLSRIDSEKQERIKNFCNQFTTDGIKRQSSVDSIGSHTTVTPAPSPAPEAAEPAATMHHTPTEEELAKSTESLAKSAEAIGLVIASSTITPAPSPVPSASQQTQPSGGEEEAYIQNPLNLLDSYYRADPKQAGPAARAETVIQPHTTSAPLMGSSLAAYQAPLPAAAASGAAAAAARQLDADDWVVIDSTHQLPGEDIGYRI